MGSLSTADGEWNYGFLRYPAERSVVSYLFESSADLKTWSPLPAAAKVFVRHLNDTSEEATVCLPLDSASDHLFVRQRVALAP